MFLIDSWYHLPIYFVYSSSLFSSCISQCSLGEEIKIKRMTIIRGDLSGCYMAWPGCLTKSWELRASSFSASGCLGCPSVVLKAWKAAREPVCQVSVGSLEKQASGTRRGFQQITCQQEQRQTAKLKLFSRTSVWAAIAKAAHSLRWAFPLQIMKWKPISRSVLSHELLPGSSQ